MKVSPQLLTLQLVFITLAMSWSLLEDLVPPTDVCNRTNIVCHHQDHNDYRFYWHDYQSSAVIALASGMDAVQGCQCGIEDPHHQNWLFIYPDEKFSRTYFEMGCSRIEDRTVESCGSFESPSRTRERQQRQGSPHSPGWRDKKSQCVREGRRDTDPSPE